VSSAGSTSKASRYGRSVQRALTHNLGLKVASILTAIVLFSLVRGSEDAQRSVFVDVVVLLPPAERGKMLVSELPDKVKVTLRGSRSVIHAIRDQDVPPVQIDLRKGTGSYYYFEPDDFDVPAGAEIVQLAPASIPLSWARRIAREHPVLARIDGSPAPGLSAQAVQVVPEAVLVRGPETEVGLMRHVMTEPIDVEGLPVGRHEREANLAPPGSHSEIDRTVARVVIEVVEQEAEHTFEGIAVTTLGNGIVEVRPAVVDVTLWGAAASLDRVKSEHLVPVIDSMDVDATRGTQPLRVLVRGVPEGLQVRVVPDMVLVTPSADGAPARGH
jgi:YbbR domain-containing protein